MTFERFEYAKCKSILMSVVLVLSSIAPVFSQDGVREWSDTSGKFKIEAKFKQVVADSVELEKTSGEVIRVPLSRFCQEDRSHLEQLLKSAKSPPTKTPSVAGKYRPRLKEDTLAKVLLSFQEDLKRPVFLDCQSKMNSIALTTRAALADEYPSIEHALDAVLVPLDLDWRSYGGVVLITTQEDKRMSYVRVYRAGARVNANALVTQLVNTIAPDTWLLRGGDMAATYVPPNLIVVRQNARNHRQIESNKSLELRAMDAPRPNDTQVLDKLVSIDAKLKPLSNCVKDLGQACKTTIELDKPELERSGISIDSPITIALKDVQLGTLLDMLLHPLDLDYTFEKNKILITAAQRAQEMLTTLTYDIPAGPNAPALLNALQSTVAADSWEVAGGNCSLQLMRPGKLQVTQTSRVHIEIKQLLSALKQQNKP